jgi:hypothetical protein
MVRGQKKITGNGFMTFTQRVIAQIENTAINQSFAARLTERFRSRPENPPANDGARAQ